MSAQGIQRAADVAAVSSVTAAGASWLANANEIISLIAGCVAIVAGIFAIVVHYRNLQRLKGQP